MAMLLVLAGCTDAPKGQKLTPVKGKVTYKGAPLAKGRITFMPSKPGNTSSGEIVNGEYTLSTYKPSDGAPAGQYKVSISSWTQEPDMQSAGVPAIPKKYFNADQSKLTADVTEKSTPIDFDLTD
jgi:hypothetical protein